MRKPIALLLLGIVASLSNAESKEGIAGGLPKEVLPESYFIHLEPDADHLVNSGVESIKIRVQGSTNRIVLNAVEIEISAAKLTGDESEEELTPNYNSGDQTVYFETRQALAPGVYTLTLKFKSRILEVPRGLFVESYQTGKEKEQILATCMKPANARRVFPCWDEPAFRAIYQLSVRTKSAYTAVSNTPVFAQQAIGSDEKIVIFEPTRPAPSYLVALVCGRFEWLENEVQGIKLRVLTTPGKKEFAHYAMDLTRQILPYLSDYWGVPYGLAKLDQIAVPEAGADAVESLGEITYSDETLLFDPANNSDSACERLFYLVANELSRQWFGSMVTMASWDDAWLTESFARWAPLKTAEHFHPEWKPGLQAAAEKESVMALDASREAQPINHSIENGDESPAVFDSVFYQKGQSVLRMLEGFFGEEAFRAGAQAFLRAHQFASATTADFSAALEKSSGRQAAKLVAGWVDQSGFPLIRATTQCIGGKRVVSLEQVRFSIGAHDENPEQWSIPVGIFSNLSPGNVKYALLEKLSSNFDFPVCDGAIKANAGGLGFFRVLYEPAQFNDLQSNLLRLPEEDRINLLADTWAFVEAGNLEASAYFGVLDNLIQDDSLGLWKTALGTGPVPGALKVIDRLEQGQPGRENYQKFVCGIFRPKLRALGWEEKGDENAETRQFRALVIETLGFFGDRDVIDEAFKRFESYRQNPASLSPDLRAPVLLVVARYSSESTYEQLLSMIPSAPTFEEKQLLLRALSGTLEPALTNRTLLYLLTDSETPALAAQTFENLSEQGEHPEIAWEFLKSHAEELQKRLGAYRFNQLMLRSASRFSDESHAADVSDFIQNHLPSESKPFAERASESIRFREKLKTRELPVIDKWIGLKAG